MTIVQMLQDKHNWIRLTNAKSRRPRWMHGDGNGQWTVYEIKLHSKTSTIVIETDSESKACAALLDEKETTE